MTGTEQDVYARYAASYDKGHQTQRCLAEDRVIADLLRNIVRSGDRVIDAGCGTMYVYSMLHGLGLNVDYTGLDISRAMLDEAARKARFDRRIKLLQSDISRPWPAMQKADVITCMFTLAAMPVDRHEACAAEIMANLKPGGRIIIVNEGPGRGRVKGYIDINDINVLTSQRMLELFGWAENINVAGLGLVYAALERAKAPGFAYDLARKLDDCAGWMFTDSMPYIVLTGEKPDEPRKMGAGWIADRAEQVRRFYTAVHAVHSTAPLPESVGCIHCSGGGSIASWRLMAHAMYNGDPFALKTDAANISYIEPEFFRPGAGTWGGGKPSW